MKLYELAEYLLDLEPEMEVKLVDSLEPDEKGNLTLMDLTPSLMINTKTGDHVLALIRSDQVKEAMEKGKLISQVKSQDSQAS